MIDIWLSMIILQQFKDTKGCSSMSVGMAGVMNLMRKLSPIGLLTKKDFSQILHEGMGPGKNDFSEWISRYIEPKGAYQYNKPVVVLTSRATCSAAEYFVMAMKVLRR